MENFSAPNDSAASNVTNVTPSPLPRLRNYRVFKEVRALVQSAKEIWIQAHDGYTKDMVPTYVKIRRSDAIALLRSAQDSDLNAPAVASWDETTRVLHLLPSNLDGVCVSYEDLVDAGLAMADED